MVVARVQVVIEVVEEAGASLPWEEDFKEEEVVNLRAGALEGLRYLSQLFQLVIFSRETIEDSWFESKGGQVAESELQTKAILNLIQ